MPVAEGSAEAAGPGFEAPTSIELHYLGEAGGIEEALATKAGLPFHPIETGQMRGRSPWVAAHSLARMARGAAQCSALIQEFRPGAVFMTGGYVAVPVAWAAWRARPRVPLMIYLPDMVPGQAIRLTARLARKVAVTFPEVGRHFPGKAVVTGYPVRPELLRVGKAEAKASLGLRPDLPVLLVFGGSRGAHSINQAVLKALPQLLQRCQIVHICGQHDWEWTAASAEELVAVREGGLSATMKENYHLYPYLHDEMVHALAGSDLVVARAGASVLGEFPAVGLPSILVPYPYAGQHQDANAAYLAERGAAIVLPDDELETRLGDTILGLFDAPGSLGAMAGAAAALAQPDAATKLAQELCQLAGY